MRASWGAQTRPAASALVLPPPPRGPLQRRSFAPFPFEPFRPSRYRPSLLPDDGATLQALDYPDFFSILGSGPPNSFGHDGGWLTGAGRGAGQQRRGVCEGAGQQRVGM